MTNIKVDLGSRSYPILIGGDFKTNTIDAVKRRRCVIVTNSRLEKLYGKLFNTVTPLRVVVPDGERFKTIKTFEYLSGELLRIRADRGTVLIAAGGGVIGDLAGFVAATYQRGIPLIQVPTTLLAMVDSSIGGKVGVNHARGKNMIGAFYHPEKVIVDMNFLKTLPKREILCGLAEIFKYGLIRGAKFFDWLTANWLKILDCDPTAVEEAIKTSCRHKAAVVKKDERESGLRMILNFGHTWAHGFEKLGNFQKIKHGEAVFAGMFAAGHLSYASGLLDKADFEKIESALLPIIKKAPAISKFIQTVGWGELSEAMRNDKKSTNGIQKWVLLDKIGSAVIDPSIKTKMVQKSFEYTKKTLLKV